MHARLGETLIQKETLALPDIVDVLGQRPYPLKETLLEYLQELRDRSTEEAAEAAKKKAEEDAAATAAAKTPIDAAAEKKEEGG
jgi:hypothetical protein